MSAQPPAPTGSTGCPRRAPVGEERQRDAERSRRALLDAGLREFATKGYAGARVAEIAAAAGVNKQLISYYFGGKEGLYRALHESWVARESAFGRTDVPLGEVTTRCLHEALQDACPARLMLWRGLADEEAPQVDDEPDGVAAIRQRQRAGELDPALDAASVQLAIMGLVLAPVSMPHVVRGMFGCEPGSPEFEERYGAALREIIGRLAAPASAGTPPPAE